MASPRIGEVPAPDLSARLRRLEQHLESAGYAAYLSDAAPDLRYFTGCLDIGGYLLVAPGRAPWLLTSAHDEPQARASIRGWEIERWRPGEDPLPRLARQLDGLAAPLGLGGCSAAALAALSAAAPTTSLRPRPHLAADLRRAKEPGELAILRAAAAIAEVGMATLRAALRPGVSERELAAEVELAIRRHGADGLVFELKIESGPRSAWPSTYASDRVLAAGDLVLADIAPTCRGYFGDFCRTFVLGEPDPPRRRLLELVLAAHAAAVAAVRPGVAGGAVDRAARALFAAAGLEERFIHHLGHGVGLVGEAWPLLVPGEAAGLRAGEIITVEPGLYLPDLGGARVEDELLVGKAGAEYLTTFPRDLDTLVVA